MKILNSYPHKKSKQILFCLKSRKKSFLLSIFILGHAIACQKKMTLILKIIIFSFDKQNSLVYTLAPE
jgi:hypothetical protein